FNFLGEQDAQEASRVHEAVAWKTGRFKDADYTDWRDAMQSVCLIIGLEYWRLAAQRMAALAIMAEREGELYELADVNIKTLGERMAALQAVLRDLCNKHGFDYQAACNLSTVPKHINDAIKVDQAFYDERYADLQECLPGD